MSNYVEEPGIAVTFSMLGAVFQFLGLFTAAVGLSMMGRGIGSSWGHNMMGGYPVMGWGFGFGWMWVGLAAFIAGLSLFGALMMKTANVDKVRTGAVIVLVAAVVSLPMMWGLGIGSVLMFIGAVLGFTWTPRKNLHNTPNEFS